MQTPVCKAQMVSGLSPLQLYLQRFLPSCVRYALFLLTRRLATLQHPFPSSPSPIPLRSVKIRLHRHGFLTQLPVHSIPHKIQLFNNAPK